MKLLLIVLSTFITTSAFAAQGRVLARCSSTGTVSVETFEIRYFRQATAQIGDRSVYQIVSIKGGKSKILVRLDAGDELEAIFNEENGDFHQLRSIQHGNVEVKISGRSSSIEIDTPSVKLNAKRLACVYPV